MVLSAIRHAPGHVSAAEVLGQVKESYPYIDISTVYRTLGALRETRLISATDIGSGEYQYEWLESDRHHHLVCRQCGNLTLLDHEFIEHLSTGVLEDYGFQADVDHLALRGVCRSCLSGQAQDEKG